MDLISRADVINAMEAKNNMITEDDYYYCEDCDHVEMCRWYPLYGCEYRSRPSAESANRVFEAIVVEYPKVSTYKEYEGKPYFSIKYIEDGQKYIGYGTYNPEVLSEYLRQYFVPSTEPQIIRCKECKHWLTRNGGYCEIWEQYISNDAFYCGCGARRVSEDDT